MSTIETTTAFRVRYCETDQMGTYGSARVLDWFEHARTELLRAAGVPYAEMERRGVLLPVVEAHVKYLGRAAYDDELKASASARLAGRARLRFDLRIVRADGAGDVAAGYTVHAFCDRSGRPIRPPDWVLRALGARSEA